MTGIRVRHLDHIVLNVGDIEASLAFYRDKLHLEPLRVDEWRRGEAPFPSLRVSADTIIDLFGKDRSGTNADHFCLVVEPVDFAQVVSSGDFTVVSGPVTRWGARGDGTSLYVEDPDGNVVELRHY